MAELVPICARKPVLSQTLPFFFLLHRIFTRFIDLDTGKVVGKHENFEYYTIGQKARIPNFNAKYYVVGRKRTVLGTGNTNQSNINTTDCTSAISPTDRDTIANGIIEVNTNTAIVNSTEHEVSGDVYVVNDLFHPALFTPYIIQPLSGINWLAGVPPEPLLATLRNSNTTHNTNDETIKTTGGGKRKPFRCEVKCRYSQLPTGCTMELIHDPALLAYNNSNYSVVHANLDDANDQTLSNGSADFAHNNVMIKIAFDVPQRAITPGQILAIYEKEVVLGGAVIAVQPLHLANGELLML